MDVTLHRGTHYTLIGTGATDASVQAVSGAGRVLRVFIEGETVGDDAWWVLLDSPVVVEASGTTVTATTVDDSFNTSGTWDRTPGAGSFIRTTGFVNAGNNSVFRVVSATTQKIVVAASLTTEGGTPTTTVTTWSTIGNFKSASGSLSFPWPIHFTEELFVGQVGSHVGTISIEHE